MYNSKSLNKDMEKYLTMSLEDLKENRIISNSNGRPSYSLTDEKWQREFAIKKFLTKKKDESIKRLGGLHSRIPSKWNGEKYGTYYGETNWQQYCSFINDVLKNIRHGNIDYLYFIYQIDELLKFDFGELELMTKYCDGYWEVWLS